MEEICNTKWCST